MTIEGTVPGCYGGSRSGYDPQKEKEKPYPTLEKSTDPDST